ncbi:cysteine-rich protein [Elephant endotheliotropic herpesvirus 3B]|nr:cysteine-rich protein [Elephant endotheliotropic herpesvirus 3B]
MEGLNKFVMDKMKEFDEIELEFSDYMLRKAIREGRAVPPRETLDLHALFNELAQLCQHNTSEHMQSIVFGYEFNKACPLAWFRTENRLFRHVDLAPYRAAVAENRDEAFRLCNGIMAKHPKDSTQAFEWMLYTYFIMCVQKLAVVLNFGILNCIDFHKLEYLATMLVSENQLPEITLYMFNRSNVTILGAKFPVPVVTSGVNSQLVNIKYYRTCFNGRSTLNRYLGDRLMAAGARRDELERGRRGRPVPDTLRHGGSFLGAEEMRRAARGRRGTALAGATETPPAGNFLCAMIRAMIDVYCARSDRYLVPIVDDINGQHSDLYRYAMARSLRRGLLGSVIELPLLCPHKLKCEETKKDVRVIVCENCGHCLNIGKLRLNSHYMLNLNSLFYYRDQQEKAVHYSLHYDIPHCSLCGSIKMKIISLYEGSVESIYGMDVYVCRWRAVIGNNNSAAVFNHRKVDVIVPCSHRLCWNTTALYNVQGAALLQLLTHKATFLCNSCSLRLPGPSHSNGASPCAACDIVKHEQRCCTCPDSPNAKKRKRRRKERGGGEEATVHEAL